MIYKCIKSFDVDLYETEEYDAEPTGTSTIEKGSIWERRENPGDYDIMLDDCDDGSWLGISQEHFKEFFVRIR